jgi:hypothetical protein
LTAVVTRARIAPQLAVAVGCEAPDLELLLVEWLNAVNVFFELGREGTSFGQGRLEAYRLVDILHHARLQYIEQVISCLDLITEALRQVRGVADATFYGLDDDGHCFIAAQTQQNIFRLWRDVIGGRQIASHGPAEMSPRTSPAIPQPAFGTEDDRLMATRE